MNIKHILYLFALAIVLTSCEEVIILDLENDEPQLVIEAVVDATLGTVSVQLTQSNGFYDNDAPKTFDGADIKLITTNGESLAVPLIQSGRYFATGFEFEEGEELEIQITDEQGQLHTAMAIVPHPVSIDKLESVETNFGGRGGGGGLGGRNDSDTQLFQVVTHWLDAPEEASFYRIKAYENEQFLANAYTMIDDISRDGDMLSRPVFDTFEEGSEVQIQLLSLDKGMYLYFFDLSNIQGQGGGGGSTTPYNPKGNFENALGYFGIQQSDTRVIVL